MPDTKYFFDKKTAVKLYKNIILPRKIEERMLKLLRQNRISKWFSGIGQEAIAVGVASALEKQDYICTMHRNLGVFTTREVPLYNLFCQLLGRKDGFTAGRERSFHFGIPEYRIIGMISHLAAMLPVGAGLALASKMKKEGFVALAFCGEGSTSEGDFHEALNLAAVWNLPVIFMIENNGYALSTPVAEQYACESLIDRAQGYGMRGFRIDGNNINEVFETVRNAREYALGESKPVFIEAMTFRMRGHEEASGTAYVPKHLFEEWEKKDPILAYRNHLLDSGILTEDEIAALDADAARSFLPELERALESEPPVFDEEVEKSRVFAPVVLPEKNRIASEHIEGRYIDGISRALEYALDEDETCLIIGQDIAEYGGAFKVTKGFVEKYGRERIRNTPIIESGAVGAAIGLALEGFRPVVEMQFADFISCGFNQIVNNLATTHYRWGTPLNVTIRSPHGAGVGAGPFHSQSPEGWFMRQPGLKVIVPATVDDALNLTYSAMLDPNPVLIFEHKRLYRSLKGLMPTKPIPEILGKAKVRREGSHATVVTYGFGVHVALETAEAFATEGVEVEVIDLRSLVPLDMETVSASVRKTGRVMLLEEASDTLGPLCDVSSRIAEECFEFLDAPVMRCASIQTPIPTNRDLENGYLAYRKFPEKLRKLLAY